MNEIQVELPPQEAASDLLPGEATGEPGKGMLALLGAAQRIHARLEAALESAGLSSAKYQALDLLARSGRPMALSELAACLHCVRSNVTQLVDRLEADGLVERASDPRDRRATRATLTPQGVARHLAGLEAVGRVERELASRLAPAERATLLRALGALDQ